MGKRKTALFKNVITVGKLHVNGRKRVLQVFRECEDILEFCVKQLKSGGSRLYKIFLKCRAHETKDKIIQFGSTEIFGHQAKGLM